MQKLLTIEWLKYKPNRAFWILIGLFVILQAMVLYGLDSFVLDLSGNNNGQQINFRSLGVLTLPKIWVYLGYISGFFKIILAVAVIMLLCNEFEFRSFRQQMIDGLSRNQLVWAKFITISVFTILSGIILASLVLLFVDWGNSDLSIFTNSEFLLAYMLQMFGYLSFAFLLALVIRKTGLTIIILLLYTYAIEPIIVYKFPEVGAYFPLETFYDLIKFPFSLMPGTEFQSSIDITLALRGIFYCFLFWLGSFTIVKKRDF